jgi:hypothetical protein
MKVEKNETKTTSQRKVLVAMLIVVLKKEMNFFFIRLTASFSVASATQISFIRKIKKSCLVLHHL